MGNVPPVGLLAATCCVLSVAAADGLPPDSSATVLPEATAALAAEGEEANLIVVENLTDKSEVEYSVEDGISYYRYGVKVRYQDSELVADQVVLRHETGDIIADGNVRLRSENQYFSGDHVEYNVKTRRINSDHFRAGFAPFAFYRIFGGVALLVAIAGGWV